MSFRELLGRAGFLFVRSPSQHGRLSRLGVLEAPGGSSPGAMAFFSRAIFVVFYFILCIVEDSDLCGDEEFIAVGEFVLLMEALPSFSQEGNT